MAPGLKPAAFAAAAFLALTPLSCVTPPDERGRDPSGIASASATPSGSATPSASATIRADERALTATLEAMLRALEEENAFAFLEHVSERFVPSRLGLKADVDVGLELYLGYGYHVRYDRINIDGDRGTLVVEWKLVRMNRETSQADIHSGGTELLFLREDASSAEGGRWALEAVNGEKIFSP
jgi:hypothetical protein